MYIINVALTVEIMVNIDGTAVYTLVLVAMGKLQ